MFAALEARQRRGIFSYLKARKKASERRPDQIRSDQTRKPHFTFFIQETLSDIKNEFFLEKQMRRDNYFFLRAVCIAKGGGGGVCNLIDPS